MIYHFYTLREKIKIHKATCIPCHYSQKIKMDNGKTTFIEASVEVLNANKQKKSFYRLAFQQSVP